MATEGGKTLVGKAQEAVLAKQASKDAGKPSRHLDRRDTEEAADRWIAEQLPDVPLCRMTEIVINGRSARQKVIEDKREARKRKGRLTQLYALALRRKYKLGFVGELVIVDPVQPIQDTLMSALKVLTKKKQRQPLHDWLRYATSCNQRELVVVERVVLKCSLCPTGNGMTFVVDFMKFVRRLGMDVKERATVMAVRGKCDDALVLTLCEMCKGEDVDPALWWESFGEVAQLVVDKTCFEELLAARGSWREVDRQLTNVVKGSKVGEKAFGWAIKLVTAEKVAAALQENMNKLVGNARIGDDEVAAYKQACCDVGELYEVTKHLAAIRCIEVDFRGLQLRIEVTSFLDEVNVRWAFWVKVRAKHDQLESLEFDIECMDAPAGFDGKEIAPDLLKSYGLARKQCKKMIGSATGHAAIKIMRKRKQVLLAQDSSFVPAGTAMLHRRIVAALPSASVPRTLDGSIAALKQLREGTLCKWVNSDAVASLDSVVELLGNIAAAEPIKQTDLQASDLMKQIGVALPLFVSKKLPAQPKKGQAKAQPERTVFGAEALTVVVTELAEKIKHQPLSLSDLHPLHAFSFLLSPEQQQQLDQWSLATNKVVGASKRKSAGSTKAPKKSKAAKAVADDDDAELAALLS